MNQPSEIPKPANDKNAHQAKSPTIAGSSSVSDPEAVDSSPKKSLSLQKVLAIKSLGAKRKFKSPDGSISAFQP
jgi:hypothetical protein